jgi:hypothetical protein
VHALAPERGLDLWGLAEAHERWLPFVDAVYGSATYMPMRDGDAYVVSLTQSGLVARLRPRAARGDAPGGDAAGP